MSTQPDGTGFTETAWGHAGRHYAASMQDVLQAARAEPATSDRWAKALEDASPGTRGVVERTYKQWNAILRDYLRTETGLRLTVGDDAQAVPVRVVDGLPRPLADVMRQFEGLEWLLLNRPAIEGVATGTVIMARHLGSARALWGDAVNRASEEDIRRVRDTARGWLQKLDESKAVEQLVGIQEDVLGAYFFGIPEIRLYWVVIGIGARALGVPVEALTIVVFAHELAHAYTHLCRDIDSDRWDTEQFARTDLSIVEGLAQFYALVVCRRLAQRMPQAGETYDALLDKQRGPYLAHLQWLGDDQRAGEIVRASMIECRLRGITASAEFDDAIKRHRAALRGQPGG
jgi:hypothetical protein